MDKWNVSLVTNMDSLFYYKWKFNADISKWDVSSVTSMRRMFYQQEQFTSKFNQDITRWDVSKVANMYQMFRGYFTHGFDRDIRRWNTTAAVEAGEVEMFGGYQEGRFQIRYANCGYDPSSHTACSEVDPSSYASSDGAYHGPPDAWVRKDNACDASTPPYFGGVGNCTDTLVSGEVCVPTCDPGYLLNGVTSCTDRILTEAVCAWPSADRA